MTARPKVTQAEFERIACNRCGACCEKLWLPSPLKLVEYLGVGASVANPTEDWRLENRRFVAWLSALEPTGKIALGPDIDESQSHQYRCTRFTRLEDGSGFCIAYEDRPSACRGFPYGRPVSGADFENCSYNVEIMSESVGRRLRRFVSSAIESFRR